MPAPIMDFMEKNAELTAAAAANRVAFTKPGWRDATAWASDTYDRGYDNGWDAAMSLAPHDNDCAVGTMMNIEEFYPCSCWKSEVDYPYTNYTEEDN